jgi:hypothetical protein
MSFQGMGKSIQMMRAPTPTPTPQLIIRMSFQLAIPRRDALQQRPPPLPQPLSIVLLRSPRFGTSQNGNEQRIALKIKTV